MNMIAQAQSGTGKTAAFVLAMLSRVNPDLEYTQVLTNLIFCTICFVCQFWHWERIPDLYFRRCVYLQLMNWPYKQVKSLRKCPGTVLILRSNMPCAEKKVMRGFKLHY